MEGMMAPNGMAPTYFFYTPEFPENRQQPQQHPGHFIAHPSLALNGMHHGLGMYPMVPTLPSTPVYSRPSSSCSQPPMQHNKAFTSIPQSMTPMASPRPVAHKPAMMLKSESPDLDSYPPSTPPLSISGSASVMSSPGSVDMLQTPLNPMFSGLDGVGSKEVVDVDGLPESFPNLDWSSCASPPITPIYLQNRAQPLAFPAKAVSLNSNSDLLSTASCPSLSPSPPPYARSVSSDDVDFCDPRNLTVGTVNSTLAPEFSGLPTLCAGDDEEHELVFRGEPVVKTTAPAISTNSSFEFNPALQLPADLPSFDDLSDLESEDDFVNGLVNLGEPALPTPTQSSVSSASRSRASSDAVSLGHSSYTCEEDFEDFDFPQLIGAYEDGSDAHKDKRVKQEPTSDRSIMSTAADAQSGSPQRRSTPLHHGDREDSNSNTHNAGSDNSGAENNASTVLPAPQNRRGRKQSLTEDPTKTFVCDLCNRRFRRQEHLKRHYRSLHTQEKPFECHECGKKFSRSDNLSQHARTHGSGAIVMDIMNEPLDMLAAGHAHPYAIAQHHAMLAGHPLTDDYHHLGKVLFQVAAEIPGSASESSSGEDSDYGKRKRKQRPE